MNHIAPRTAVDRTPPRSTGVPPVGSNGNAALTSSLTSQPLSCSVVLKAYNFRVNVGNRLNPIEDSSGANIPYYGYDAFGNVTFKPKLMLPVEKLKKKVINILRLQRFEKWVQVSAAAGGSFSVADCSIINTYKEIAISKDAKITLESFIYIGIGENFDKNIKHFRGFKAVFDMEGKIKPDESGLNIEFEINESPIKKPVLVPIPFTG